MTWPNPAAAERSIPEQPLFLATSVARFDIVTALLLVSFHCEYLLRVSLFPAEGIVKEA
jgi:hypothetical protein